MSISATSSDAQSPLQAAARSPRVCMNCRRKKKRCDKALPSCGRCIASLELCQHEDDDGSQPGESTAPGSLGFQSVMGKDMLHTPFSGDVSFERMAIQHPGPSWNTLTPTLFASMDSGENIDSYVCRCLNDIIGNRARVQHIVGRYFSSVNTWFTIVPQSLFIPKVEELSTNPSAEAGVLILAMLLAVRGPTENAMTSMADSLYLSVKALVSVTETKLPQLSVPILQAELIIALYETFHFLPQQAFMTIGRCFQIVKAFGWHQEAFWTEERRNVQPQNLKLYSTLWWATVFLDSLLHEAYPERKLLLNTVSTISGFAVPFPDEFDQYLQAHVGYAAQAQNPFLDVGIDHIDSMVWPESSSAWFLSNILQRLARAPAVATVERNNTSSTIMSHTLRVMKGNWMYGGRSAVVGTNFIALMELNRPFLEQVDAGVVLSVSQDDYRAVSTIRSIVSSIINACELSEQSPKPLLDGIIAPCQIVCAYSAGLLLVRHSEGILQEPQWLEKVELIKRNLALFRKRWTLADHYLGALNVALNNRLGIFPA